MSEDWLKRWYRDSFSRSSAKGLKDETWEKINSQIEDWSGYWYKTNSKEIKLKPEHAVWENINAELQVIAAGKRNARMFWMKAASITALFILTPYLLNDIQESYSVNSGGSVSSNNNMTTLNSNSIDDLIQAPILIASEQSTGHNHSTINVVESPVIKVIASTKGQSIENNNNPLLIEAPQKLPLLPLDRTGNTSTPTINIIDQSKKFPSRGLWSVGAVAKVQHSYLLNPISIKGLSNQSSVKNAVNADLAFDFSVFRKLTNNGILSAKFVLNDRKSQSYEDFDGPLYIKKHLELNYQTLGVSYHQPLFPNKLKGALGFEASAGVFGSYRTNISEKWGEEYRYDLIEGFKKFNLGINVGLDGVYNINNSFDLTVGVYYTNGVMNIFKGTEYIPAHFLRTFTSSFGMNAGVRFHL